MFNKKVIALLTVLVIVLSALIPLLSAQDDMTDVYGRPLPEDAAPYEMQVVTVLCNPNNVHSTFSAVVSVYERICLADQFSDNLVFLDSNLNLIPGAAESWEPSEDGLTWTFKLREGMMWSDGTPVTAQDYAASYQYTATPESAYDFTWMWSGIIDNYSEVVAGELPPEELGVQAIDDLTLEVRTEFPFPPLPNTLFFWAPLQAKALAEIGPDYLLDPATSVSSGPFKLKEFSPGESVVLEANPDYTGIRPPRLREMRGVYSAVENYFLAFQNYDVEWVPYENLSAADFEVIASDPLLEENYLPDPGDFRTDYILMDTYTPPFDNVQVRQAFAKALDRESIVANVIGPRLAVPAYSMLAPGFPAADSEGLRQYQDYDCPAAQQLLADAGYPNGEGFPALTLQLRGEPENIVARYVAAAASISECLNIPIEVNNMEFSAYMEALLARPTTLQFGGVSYGMDYLDAANLLGTLWKSDGRHSWRNAEFDRIATEANSLVGDPERRTELYQEAERILVEDVGAIFFYHRIQGELFQPYLQGDFREPNAQGLPGWQWGNDWMYSSFYIDNTVTEYPTYRTAE